MKAAAIACLLLVSGPALGEEFNLGREAAKCFNFGPQDIGIGAEAEISVGLGADGLATDIDVLRYSPDSEDGRRLAMAAAKAVQACGPYPIGTMGQVIIMGPDVVYPDAPDSIITMPDRADGLDDSLANEIGKIIGQ